MNSLAQAKLTAVRVSSTHAERTLRPLPALPSRFFTAPTSCPAVKYSRCYPPCADETRAVNQRRRDDLAAKNALPGF